jgi:hypothetical protein
MGNARFVYREPTGDPPKIDTFDVTAAHPEDATATFTDATLNGDFYNGIRGGSTGGGGPFGGLPGKNMVLTFDDSRVSGVISASQTRHAIETITSADYLQLGEVANTGPSDHQQRR